MTSFNFDSLNIDELLSNDELTSIDAAGTAISLNMPKGLFENAPNNTPGYTEATIIWSQIP